MIEPSAGTGAFSGLLPSGSLACDIDPKADGIIQADFLKLALPNNRNIAVIGNPPFGRACGMAIRFFNHAATKAKVIAFILPRTFCKVSVQKKLHRNFHLLYELKLPAFAFIFRGKPYDVPTVFQIWVCRDELRIDVEGNTTHPDFQFTDVKNADFAIQRVGANAGCAHQNFAVSKSSHYFIKGNVQHIMAKFDFATVAAQTAGCPSLSKREIVALYSEYRAASPLRQVVNWLKRKCRSLVEPVTRFLWRLYLSDGSLRR